MNGKVPVAGMVLVLGIDRFMSEARAITNLFGNAVATIFVAWREGRRGRSWTGPGAWRRRFWPSRGAKLAR
jgi:Na+/H+-dicarboxylate symporter